MKDIYTLQELAEYLKMHPKTLQRKAREGAIPAFKLGRQFRFDKGLIDKWLLKGTTGGSVINILVVDDEPLVGELFKNSLNRTSYQVTTTLSSLEALELVNSRPFNLIFLDLVMPELDGAELFRRIRQVNKSIPVTIITGYPDSEVMKRAMEYGPFMVLKKPFTGDDILNAIRSFVAG